MTSTASAVASAGGEGSRQHRRAVMRWWTWRGATVPLERLEDVSEALLSVAATLQVSTLEFSAVDAAKAGGFAEYLLSSDRLQSYQAFAIGFMVVLIYRSFHVQLFHAVARPHGRVSATTFVANCVFLLFLCLLPYSTSLVSANPRKHVGESFLHVNLTLVAASLCLVAHTMKGSPELLVKDHSDTLRACMIEMGGSMLTSLCFAVAFSVQHHTAHSLQWGAFIVVAAPFALRLMMLRLSIRVRKLGRERAAETARVEAFADGVFGLAATLAVTDFGAVDLSSDVDPAWAFRHSFPSMASFVMMFVIASLLWHANHHLFYSGDPASPTTLEHVVNSVVLLLVGGIPFGSEVYAHAFDSGVSAKDQLVAAEFFVTLASAPALVQLMNTVIRARRTNWERNKAMVAQAAVLPAGLLVGLGVVELSGLAWLNAVVLLVLVVPYVYIDKWERRRSSRRKQSTGGTVRREDVNGGSVLQQSLDEPLVATSGAGVGADGAVSERTDTDQAARAAADSTDPEDAVPSGLDSMSMVQMRALVVSLSQQRYLLHSEVLRLLEVTGEDAMDEGLARAIMETQTGAGRVDAAARTTSAYGATSRAAGLEMQSGKRRGVANAAL